MADYNDSFSANAEIQLPSAPTTVTGTISSTGKVVTGISTLFTTECEEGGWLYNGTDKEFIKIVKIFSDTLLTLEFTPETDFSGDTVEYLAPIRCASFAVANTGTASATIIERGLDGVMTSSTMKNGMNKYYGVSRNYYMRSQASIPNPIVVNGASTTIEVTVSY